MKTRFMKVFAGDPAWRSALLPSYRNIPPPVFDDGIGMRYEEKSESAG